MSALFRIRQLVVLMSVAAIPLCACGETKSSHPTSAAGASGAGTAGMSEGGQGGRDREAGVSGHAGLGSGPGASSGAAARAHAGSSGTGAAVGEGGHGGAPEQPLDAAMVECSRSDDGTKFWAVPGELVVLYETPYPDAASVSKDIASAGARLLEGHPDFGFYLLSVSPGSEPDACRKLFAVGSVYDVVPNLIIEEFGTRVSAIEVDCDDRHGTRVTGILSGSTGGSTGDVFECASSAKPDMTLDEVLKNASAQTVREAQMGASTGDTLVNVSLGPAVVDLWGKEIKDLADAGTNERERNQWALAAFWRDTLVGLAQLPAESREHVLVTFAAGNSNMDLDGIFGDLLGDPHVAAFVKDHVLFVGSAYPGGAPREFSNHASAAYDDFVYAANSDAKDGTSFAAPYVLALARQLVSDYGIPVVEAVHLVKDSARDHKGQVVPSAVRTAAQDWVEQHATTGTGGVGQGGAPGGGATMGSAGDRGIGGNQQTGGSAQTGGSEAALGGNAPGSGGDQESTSGGSTGSCVPIGVDATCDGVDDDCDGVVDDDYVAIGPVSCGVGACKASGTKVCGGGTEHVLCEPGTPAAADTTCNGIDDDCDGQRDEDSSCQWDPCAGAAGPCESETFGPLVVYSSQTDQEVTTTVTDGSGEVMTVTWTEQDEEGAVSVTVSVTLVEYGTSEIDDNGDALPTLEEANRASAAVFALNNPGLDAGPGAPAPELRPPEDNTGCNVIDDNLLSYALIGSCSSKGHCCDTHDVCIYNNCRGPNNSGFVFGCNDKHKLYSSCLDHHPVAYCEAHFPRCSPECQKCHDAVWQCMWHQGPGPAKCCQDGRNRCGIPSECYIGDTPLFDACLCDTLGAVSVHPCNRKPGPGRSGGGQGDPHYTTFDGLAYDLQPVGEFTLVRSLDDDFEVQTRTAPWGSSAVVAVQTGVAMRIGGVRLGVYAGRASPLSVEGRATELASGDSLELDGVSVARSADTYVATGSDGATVLVAVRSDYLDVTVQLPEERLGRVVGLLGNANAEGEDDIALSDGTALGTELTFDQLYHQYAMSWRITQDHSLFDYREGTNTETYTDLAFPARAFGVADLPESVREAARKLCLDGGITDPILLEACILDVGVTADGSFVEGAADAIVPEAQVGYSCSPEAASCHPLAACVNTEHGFECQCQAGYAGDGVTGCADIDECALGTHTCGAGGICTNSVGGFTCACRSGYVADGVGCADIDECALGTDDCAPEATCTNARGSFLCTCPEGFEGDGRVCTDIDECAEDPGPCLETSDCVNLPGGYDCTCTDPESCGSFELQVGKAGSGAGTVTSSTPGIECGEQCSATYDEGSHVVLSYTLEPGSRFGGWSGACTGLGPECEVLIEGAQNVTATFVTDECVEGESTALEIGASSGCAMEGSQSGTDHDSFVFYGTAGSDLRIIAKGTSGSVSPRVQIRDPHGTLVHDGTCFPGCEPDTFNFVPADRLAMTGTYTLEVSDVGENNWGNYEIFLGCLEGPCFESSPLDYDTSVADSFPAYGIEMDFFSFQGEAGSNVRLVAKGTSGSVSPRVQIRDPHGTLLHDGTCFPGCEPSTFNIAPSPTLPLSGTYTLAVSETGQDNWGNYELFLGCLDGPCFESSPLGYDTRVTDSFPANGTDMDFFSFEGEAGSGVRLVAKGTSGSVSARVEIRDPEGKLVHDGVCFPGCEPSTFNIAPSPTLPLSGTYTLAVSETNQDNWGNYELYLGCLEGSCFESSPLAYDTPVTDSFPANGTDMDFFHFEGDAGSAIRLVAKGSSGSVSPRVEIRDPEGRLVHDGTCFPDCEPSTFNISPSSTLPVSGTYTLAVSETNQDNWGDYELYLGCVEGGCFQSSELGYDTNVADSFPAYGVDEDFFSFQGEAGSTIRLVAKGTSGSVSPRVQIRDPDGTLVHDGTCFPGCEPSTFNIAPSPTLPLSGTYTLAVSETNQDNWGNYELYLGCLDGPCFASSPLGYDTRVTDSFPANGTDMDFFHFEGDAGSSVRLIAKGTSGSVSPHVEIRDPEGRLVHDGTCFPDCEPSTFNISPSPTLPVSGTYTLAVSETNQDNWGDYELYLGCVEGGCFQSFELGYDTNVADSFPAYGVDEDFFSFQGEAGSTIRLVVKGTSGSVSPRVQIRDPDGTLVHDGTCFPGCEPSTFSIAPSPTLPLSGTYTLAVSETNQDNWGNYELYLGCLEGSCFQSAELHYDTRVTDAFPAYGIDMDFFSFQGTAGSTIHLVANGTSGSVTPRVELRDPAGALVHNGTCSPSCEPSTFNISPSPALTMSGTYTLAVSETNQDNWGNYELLLSCAGGCGS